jgi:hypothetical protein
MRIYTTKIKTHLIRAEEGIIEAMKKTSLASENWAYPIKHYGMPYDMYYAEVWQNGMDWQHNYWVIETHTFEDPKVYPLLFFQDHAQEEKFNQYDFGQLLDAIFWYRRNLLWIKKNDPHQGVYGDNVWPYIVLHEKESKHEWEALAVFSHASQEPIQFSINKYFVPENRRP